MRKFDNLMEMLKYATLPYNLYFFFLLFSSRRLAFAVVSLFIAWFEGLEPNEFKLRNKRH